MPAGSPGFFFARNVKVSSNGDNGIDVATNAEATIQEATVSDNVKNGILVDNAGFVTIKNSRIADNSRNGILLNNVSSGGTHTAVQNVICGNVNGGLDVNSPNAAFDAEGNWKIVKTHQMSDEEIAELQLH